MNHDTFTDPHQDLLVRGNTRMKPRNTTNTSELEEDFKLHTQLVLKFFLQALRRSTIKLCCIVSTNNSDVLKRSDIEGNTQHT